MICMILLKKITRRSYIILILFFIFLGVFRYGASNFPSGSDISHLCSSVKQKILVYGIVDGIPEEIGKSYLKHLKFPFKVLRVLKNGKEKDATGEILVHLYDTGKNTHVGDKLVLGGYISLPRPARNPCGPDQRRYLTHKGIHSVMACPGTSPYLRTGISKSPVYLIKRFLAKSSIYADGILKKYLVSDARSIIRAVTLGKRNNMPAKTKTLFAETGTMHILAVSGLHIGIVAGILIFSMKLLRLPNRIMYIVAIAGVLIFAVFAGARSSSLRAAIMVAFALAGVMLNRKTDMLNLLGLSAFLITFFSPGQLFMPGFILSYLAVICIVYIVPFIDALLIPEYSGYYLSHSGPRTVKTYLYKAVSVSLGVFLGTTPVIALYFRIITPASIIANLAAVPLLFILVSSGLVLLALGMTGFLTFPARIISAVISYTTDLLVKVLSIIRNIPFSHIHVSSPGFFL